MMHNEHIVSVFSLVLQLLLLNLRTGAAAIGTAVVPLPPFLPLFLPLGLFFPFPFPPFPFPFSGRGGPLGLPFPFPLPFRFILLLIICSELLSRGDRLNPWVLSYPTSVAWEVYESFP